MQGQEGFDFDGQIPHREFEDDPTPPYKLHRRADPDTSRDAAYSLKNLNLMEEKVYRAIESFGPAGCISDEVVDCFRGQYGYSTVTARYKALLEKGFIRDTGIRRKGKSGRSQRVMTIIRRAV